ncbi:MAG: hypothetical protein U5L05_00405 [Rubrivivax sp.]|nr:hypothetical protein [Rubrivivax sp.]
MARLSGTEPDPATPAPGSLPLWPLALLAALLPAVAALLALWLAVRAGAVPACNPFVDGCVSISRAARHDLPNHVFRSLMLPAATLQGLVWLLAARWLRAGLGPTRGLRALAPLGLTAAVALVLYASFLGTEGPVYRGLRQYGTVVYFGFTCLCLLLAGDALVRLAARRQLALPLALPRSLAVLAAVLVALGLVNAAVAALFGEPLKGRIENVTEWWGALVFVLGFGALAAVWWHAGLRVTIGSAPR